eukprot:CAMPEP_0182428072 /NCGR_PEP_ID=MMETSP1167-20130531/20999_1 /TAXON_ID=2988 /ORGANISM="Mallomonas Sp, Strain CCMP3275" /LENGTH=164 /DNA_ID=CAMNT_0024610727 /DNA_START=61 /DNA_END=552 /DNA_ORIENTATION=+
MSKFIALVLSLGIAVSSARNGLPVSVLKSVRISDNSLSLKGGEISDILTANRVLKVVGSSYMFFTVMWLMAPDLFLELLGTEVTTDTKQLGRYIGLGFGAFGALLYKSDGDILTGKISTVVSAAKVGLILLGGKNGSHKTENWFYKLQMVVVPVHLVAQILTFW